MTCDLIVKYVQAGLCEDGNGSKYKPYKSLALAQADTTWEILIVLCSPFILDGGITLRPGTKLIGEKSPVSGPLSGNEPTITNSACIMNGGNGVVVSSGNAIIENLYFKDTWASAINYDNATNVSIKNVLITGHNQGSLLVPIGNSWNDPVQGITSVEVAGIHGQNKNKGTTYLSHVKITRNHTGPGLLDAPYGKTKRKLKVNNCEFSYLTSNNSNPHSNGLDNYAMLLASAYESGTNYKVKITNSSFHDAVALSNCENYVNYTAIYIKTANGAKSKVTIERNNIYNLYNTCNPMPIGIQELNITIYNPPNVLTGVRSCNQSVITNNTFMEQENNLSNCDVAAWQGNTINSVFDYVIAGNVISNVLFCFLLVDGGHTNENGTIKENVATGSAGFINTTTENVFSDPSNIVVNLQVKNNIFTGGNFCGAIVIVPGFFTSNCIPWASLTMCVEGNCFSPLSCLPFGCFGIGFLSLDENCSGPNTIINASYNNVTGYVASILAIGSTSWNAEYNYWGPGGPEVFQEGSGITDVNNPLANPICCPKFKYCVPTPICDNAQVVPQARPLTRDFINGRVQNFKNKFSKKYK